MNGTGSQATFKRTATEFMEDNLTDWAAALTYYGLLALFPALIAMGSLIGLVGDPKSTTSTLTEIITSIGPKSAAETFSGPIESITSNQSAAGFAFVAGLAVALCARSSLPITGKLELWQALERTLGSRLSEVDFSALIERAESQRQAVEGLRLDAAAEALAEEHRTSAF